jgi:hypothetical protein
MTDYRFEREARTPYSEAFTIDDGEHSLGRVDIHYTTSTTYATLAVHQALDEDGVQALIAAIDERIVSTADPYREDFVVTVWRGEEFGVFADETEFDDDDLEADEDDDDEDDTAR